MTTTKHFAWAHSLMYRSLLYNKHATYGDEDARQGCLVEEHNMKAKAMAAY
jgi:hypothetical protein